MASPNTGGYDQEFLDPPAKLKDFECPLCLLVTREPNQTSCCGQDFCQSCINRILTDRKPCSFCQEVNFSVFLDKKQRRKVLVLKVQCSMKECGCEWTGELGELASHTDPQNGNCQFVDVTCPNDCGESHQRRHQDSHLSDTCPKRPFTCEYCGFESTHEEVWNSHYPKCTKFPLPCPNECEVGSVERGSISEHLSRCPLQLVECEYAHAGCCERIQQKDLAMHMEQNVQKHLLWAFTASQKQIVALEKEMKKQTEVNDKQIREVKQQVDEVRTERDRQIESVKQQFDEVRKEKNKQLEEKDRQIDTLERRLTILERHAILPPPVEFTVSDYSWYKGTGTSLRADCPLFYTHLRGAKVQVRTVFNYSATVCVELWRLPGEFDDLIEWPVKCIVTVHLLNQLRDQDHISGSRTIVLARPTKRSYARHPDPLDVECNIIEDRSRREVQYLKDDCIRFRVGVELK